MALPVFHPCRFNFDDVDFRRVGNIVSAGSSLSGYDDPIETTGGGHWRLDLTNGEALDRETGLAWRALTEAMDGGAQAVVVLLCSERLFQPVLDQVGEHYNASVGAAYQSASGAALRATAMQITGAAEQPLLGGELFSVEHSSWGWRTYRILSIDGATIAFRPPLREAVAAGTHLEFDEPRCKMRILPGAAPSNPTNIGTYTACSITFVEDMRKPS